VNKTTLAAVATAALLVGGLSSFEHRDGTGSASAAPQGSGRQSADGTAGVWADVSSGTAVPIPDIARFVVAPGDVLTCTLTSTVLAQGDTAPATLAADPTSITDDPDLLAAVALSTAITVDGAPAVAIGEADDGRRVQAVVTLDVDESLADPAQLEDLHLGRLRLALQPNAG
jgi:alternate signal-mediated exported protein